MPNVSPDLSSAAINCALFAEEIVRVLLGAKWMEAAPIVRLLAPTALGIRVSQSTFLVGYVDGPSWPRLVHYWGNNAASHRGDCAGSELWTQRSRVGVLVGYGTPGLPDHRLV